MKGRTGPDRLYRGDTARLEKAPVPGTIPQNRIETTGRGWAVGLESGGGLSIWYSRDALLPTPNVDEA